MTELAARPWKLVAGGVMVSVRATPKGGRDSIDGVMPTGEGACVLKVRVRVAPTDGEANDALVRLLAKAAGVPRSAVELHQGAAGRLKTFRISGDPAKLVAALEQAIAEQGKKK